MKYKKRYLSKRLSQKGFTVLELIFTIIIIGILAAFVTNQLLLYKKNAYNADARAEAKNFYSFIIAYISDRTDNVVIDLNDDSSLPEGYSKKSDIDYSGKFEYENGDITSKVKFSHKFSNNMFTVDSFGIVKKIQ